MNKLIFITGLPGTGKTSYIQQHYANRKGYYIFDLAEQGKKMFGNPLALEDEDKIADIYNQTSEEALMALMDGHHLVVEFGKDEGYHDDFENLCSLGKKMGLSVECLHLTEAFSMQESRRSTDHYSSFLYAYETLEVLEGVLESYEINKTFETIMEITTEDGFITLFSMQQENGETIYFYTRDDNEVFDFEPEFDFQKDEGIKYKRVFKSFDSALHDLIGRYNILNFIPIKVHPRYQANFDECYHQHLKEGTAFVSPHAWKGFRN